MELSSLSNSIHNSKSSKFNKSDVINKNFINIFFVVQPKKFYNIFKTELSIDKSSEKTKKISQIKNSVSKEKNKLNTFSKTDKKNSKISKTLSTSNKNIVYANKNIIIKDITNNYNNINSNLIKPYNTKKTELKINEQNSGIISTDLTKNKNSRLYTGHKGTNKKNNSINEAKLNNSNLIPKKTKKIFNLSKNNKVFNTLEYNKSDSKNLIKNRNKKNNKEFGDSYEFNFTFNSYNNNFTQNNFNASYIKNTNKKNSKINLENCSNKKIINNFASVRNNILKDIKEIIKNKNNKTFIQKEKPKQNSKETKIGVIRKNNKKIKANDIYALKIQKIFRGYIFRKKNKLYNPINAKEKINSKNKVYIRKKILKKKSGLNLNINYNLSTYQNDYHLTEANLSKIKYTENKINTITQENKIEEIIIDRNKLFNVLGRPSITKNGSYK